MNQQEFQTAISPILLKWPRGYSGDQVQLINDEVKMISHPDFVRLVRHLLGSMRVAPMVPDFKKGIQDLGIRPILQRAESRQDYQPIHQEEDFLYQVRENIWADNKYIFIRGANNRTSGFILKADHPTHPYVLEDKEVRAERIKEIKNHLKNRSYSKFMEPKTASANGFRAVSFNHLEGM